MKESFTKLLQSAEPKELEGFFDGVAPEKVSKDAAARIKAKAVGEAYAKKHAFRWGGVIAAAAAIVLILSAGLTGVLVAEAKEYGDAVAFFTENGLSTDGLSRSDVKAVYRDISTKSFNYSKTADVIRSFVPGLEISQSGPTPEELAALWDRSVWLRTPSKYGISYIQNVSYVKDEVRGFDVLDKCTVECYNNGRLIWSADFDNFYVDGCAYTDEGTAVWGWTETHSPSDTTYAYIARVGDKGNVLWKKRIDHGFKNENVASILSNGDGTWAVISRGDLKFLCLSRYDANGKELSFNKTEVGNYGIRKAVRLGDGYIVQLWNTFNNDTALLYKLDRNGGILERFSYDADDCDYYIRDMVEFGGQVYISAYAVPKHDGFAGGRYEIDGILQFIWSNENHGTDISSEKLTPVVRDNYTAVLLVCDPNGGEPKAFYSVKGSLGGDLNVNENGQLLWNTESIVSTFYSPATSSFSIGGTCRVFRYTFDESGNLIRQADTGETAAFRK